MQKTAASCHRNPMRPPKSGSPKAAGGFCRVPWAGLAAFLVTIARPVHVEKEAMEEAPSRKGVEKNPRGCTRRARRCLSCGALIAPRNKPHTQPHSPLQKPEILHRGQRQAKPRLFVGPSGGCVCGVPSSDDPSCSHASSPHFVQGPLIEY